MGLFDDLAKQALGSILGGGKQQGLIDGVVGMLTKQESGGISGLVQQFSSQGLGDIANSWISTGPNMPISAEQIRKGLGNETIANLAQKAGVKPDALSSLLAQHLPGVIDKLTPQGKVPEGDISTQAMKLLGGLFK